MCPKARAGQASAGAVGAELGGYFSGGVGFSFWQGFSTVPFHRTPKRLPGAAFRYFQFGKKKPWFYQNEIKRGLNQGVHSPLIPGDP